MSPRATRPLLIALAVVPVLILTGLPPLLGTTAEAAYHETLRATMASLPPGWGLTEHYERGWFSSHASAELTPPPQTAARGRIRLRSRIEQGPWSWFGPGPWPALARIHTRADWVDGDLALPPLLSDTVIGAGGTGETRVAVPAAEPPAGPDGRRLHNAAITGLLRYRQQTREVLLELEVPGLTLFDATGPLANLRGARLQARLSGWTAGRYTGQATLEVAAAAAGAPPPGAGSAPAPVLLEGLRMTLEQTATAPAGASVGTRLDLRLDATAERLRLGGVDNSAAVLGLSATSIDIAATTDLAQALATLASERTPPAMRGLAGVSIAAQLLPRFLASGPGLVLDPVRLVTPEGPASARLALAANGQGAAAKGAAALLGALLGGGRGGFLIGLEGDAALDLPEPLARTWLQAVGPAGSDPLPGWVEGGWVSVRDGRLTSSLLLKDGQLSINGRPVALRLPGRGRQQHP